MKAEVQGTFLSPNSVHRVWGQRRIYKPANPAAGAEIQFTVSQSMLWRVISFTALLKASAQAAKRVPGLQVSDGDGNPLMVIGSNQEQAESTTRRVTFAPEVATDTIVAADPLTVGIPWLLLLPGYSVQTLTAGIQTEDQYEKPTLWIEEVEQVQFHPVAELAAQVAEILQLEKAVTVAAS